MFVWAEDEVHTRDWVKESKSRKNIPEGQSLEVHFKSEVMQSSGCQNRAGNGSIGLSHRQAARHSIYGESRCK